ncbi:hypothetical protein ACNSOO_04720 [Aliarcobacter lanthieri]|uniref:hypothetical protein n=1 Tax=Aliarcobacter lanthieri TaxID=1355374 RepID=UPI003AAB4EDB
MSYKILPIEKNDLLEINKVLIKEIGRSCLKELKLHTRQGIAIKLIDENKEIGAFCLALECEINFSLSYYYIYEKRRRKAESLFFFLYCFNRMKHKPIYIKKNKNYDLYAKYFESTDDENILRFKNLREDEQWVELLSQFQK